jgi:hypothetical protein
MRKRIKIWRALSLHPSADAHFSPQKKTIFFSPAFVSALGRPGWPDFFLQKLPKV